MGSVHLPANLALHIFGKNILCVVVGYIVLETSRHKVLVIGLTVERDVCCNAFPVSAGKNLCILRAICVD